MLAAGLVPGANGQPRRSFHVDAVPLVAKITPPLQVLGQEFVPAGGPCLLLVNHYYRPGFNAWWISLAISAIVPVEVYWVVTAALTYPGQRRGLVMRPLARTFLAYVARVYGFFGMPAMPPNPRDSPARAAAVRKVVKHARKLPGPVIGLAPEGRDILDGKLGWPPPGGGRFVLRLAKMGLKLAPVGLYEDGGCFWLRFGPAFELETPAGIPLAELDRCASRQVMEHIAGLVPERMRGEFGGNNADTFD